VKEVFILFLLASARGAEVAPLRFDQAYEQILQRSLKTATQNLQTQIAETKTLSRKMTFLPSLTAEVSRTQTTAPSATADGAALTSKINVYRFGADAAALRAAEADERAELAEKMRVKLSVEEDAAQALITVIQRLKEKETIQKIVRIQEESFEVAKQRYRRGLAPSQDVDKLSIELDNARARVTNAQTQELDARTTLDALLGHNSIIPEWPWKTQLTKQTLTTQKVDFGQRPDWKVTTSQIVAEDERATSYGRLRWPSLDLSVSYGNTQFNIPGTSPGWTGVVLLSAPLFEQFKSESQYRIQQYTYQIAQLKLAQLKREIPSQVETLRATFITALNSAQARDRTVELSRKLFQSNLLRFKMGRTSVNELAIDEDRLFESELLAIQGWGTAHLAYVKLCHSYGESVSPAGDCKPLTLQ
jgi:outer membrane protein TolC